MAEPKSRPPSPAGPAEPGWRPARPADDRRLAALCRALYAEDPGSVPAPARIGVTLARLRAEPLRGLALALEVAGRVEGYALLISYWSNELGGELVALDEIYVTPAHRGHGHASRLIEELKVGGRVWPEPPAVVELEVSPRNRKARALYLRLGLKEIRNTTLRLVQAPVRRRAPSGSRPRPGGRSRPRLP